MTEHDHLILGCWELLSTDQEVNFGDRVQMRFSPDGTLVYGSLEQDTWQIMLLTFTVRGNEIISNQPSSPQEERTSYSITPAGALELVFGGVNCVFERVPFFAFGEQLESAKH